MRILVTGAGGASAISVWKSLGKEHEIFMADIDPCAAGLYLVSQDKRFIIPPGNSADFIPTLINLCEFHQIDLLIPTVDFELLPIARHKAEFSAKAVKIPLSSVETLELCRDKYKLLQCCEATGLTPSFILLTENTETAAFDFPCFAKPRKGAGSRGAIIIENQRALDLLPKDSSYLVQELLPGDEYSVDVYIHSKGYPLAAVPRLRLKIDSGIAVACQTKNDPVIAEMALKIAMEAGIVYVANIQFKANAKGEYKLLEINPRFPGTLPLTAAAGIDIPQILIKDILNQPLGDEVLPFAELMVVRYWTEKYFPIKEWQALCKV